MLVATGLIALRSGWLPRWLGWASLILAVALSVRHFPGKFSEVRMEDSLSTVRCSEMSQRILRCIKIKP